MPAIDGPVRAVFFDMDGTLIDSEPITELVVQAIIRDGGLPPPAFDLADLHGKTWPRVEQDLVDEYPELEGVPLTDQMQADFDEQLRRRMPRPLPGAVEAFRAASRRRITGVVSSSPRATIDYVVDRLGLSAACRVIVGAEDVQRSKPDPECYLAAAANARVPPAACLVFEDSDAGLAAARAAGMKVIAVLGRRDAGLAATLARRADLVIVDYHGLPAGLFTDDEPGS